MDWVMCLLPMAVCFVGVLFSVKVSKKHKRILAAAGVMLFLCVAFGSLAVYRVQKITKPIRESDTLAVAEMNLNSFRGDVEILRPGLAMLEEKTQLPVLGVVPYLKVDIEDEDSLSTRLDAGKAVHPLDAAILRLPHISNFTDFMPLEQHPLLGVRYVQRTRQLGAPDLVILPGTKNTMDDLRWLRESGLEAARRCWGFAAGIRCWARRWPTLRARRAVRCRPCGGWGCCPPARSLPARSTAPRTLPP